MKIEAEKARDFARNYVMLVESLIKEGVAEETARNEAHMASMTILGWMDEEKEGTPCPLCGKS